MIRRVLISCAFLLSACFACKAAQLDSASVNRLGDMLERYYEAMLPMELSEKESECDFLINSCRDSLVRQFVATSILKHYMDPPLMGEEAVAIYLYEKWFDSGIVKFGDEADAFFSEMFYTFNRQSLIDMPAQPIDLYDMRGNIHAVPSHGAPCVLFFYEPTCSKCQLFIQRLPLVLEAVDYPLNFYAVNTGSDENAWHGFVDKFSIRDGKVKVMHLWDPEIESDYQKKYGVTSTPKMFFIDEEGIILGRRLDVEALDQILSIYRDYYKTTNKLSYGQE